MRLSKLFQCPSWFYPHVLMKKVAHIRDMVYLMAIIAVSTNPNISHLCVCILITIHPSREIPSLKPDRAHIRDDNNGTEAHCERREYVEHRTLGSWEMEDCRENGDQNGCMCEQGLPIQPPTSSSLVSLDVDLPDKVVLSLPGIAHAQLTGKHDLHQDFVVQLTIVRRVPELGINDLQLLLF